MIVSDYIQMVASGQPADEVVDSMLEAIGARGEFSEPQIYMGMGKDYQGSSEVERIISNTNARVQTNAFRTRRGLRAFFPPGRQGITQPGFRKGYVPGVRPNLNMKMFN